MKTQRGFTLIEMLIVIAIIAILMTIAIAVSGVLMSRAENSAAATQIQKVLAACEKFKGDFGAYPLENTTNPKVRDTGRQRPVDTVSSANGLGKFLFKKIPGEGSAQTGLDKGNPTKWYGDYLDQNDISESYIDPSNNYNIRDYWMDKPLIYWLRYKKNASDSTGEPQVTSNLKAKLTPEIWSYGADSGAQTNCLQLSAYANMKKCDKSNVTSPNHSLDTDNVGGDLNAVKK